VAKQFYELEELIVDAWPAAEALDLDGWLLRKSGGPSRRANSVATLAYASGALSLEERIERVEAFYRERGQPALFQIGPCVQPKELDSVLQGRGYAQDGISAVALAAPSRVALEPAGSFELRVEQGPSAAWSAIALQQSRFAQSSAVLRALLAQLGSRVRYVTALDHERAVGSCYLIASEERLGIYGMLTLPEARRSGVARALLHAIGRYAEAERAAELYLQVELDNRAARALYAQCGFRDAYTYHYRVRASA
jgi:N-acetylglutamate synthase